MKTLINMLSDSYCLLEQAEHPLLDEVARKETISL